ncbi:MAG: hypothetical protein GY803_07535 [Chloroflexi bacterium]|nr:hypothetical protein [Chloroflexota bacterium]
MNDLISSNHVKPNPVLVSRQIKSLREILRRMKASAREAALDPIINRKLEQLLET